MPPSTRRWRRGGRGSGRAAARSTGARARRRATGSTCGRPTTTATATRCCSSSTRRARAPATPGSAPASSAVSPTSPAPEAGASAGMPEPLHPPLTEFTELARSYTVVPVWREVLADLETPVSVFLKLVGAAGEGFLLESVEHGERWGRYSFVGRDPALTLVARAGAVRWLEGGPDAGLAAGLPADRGALGALEALLARFRAPRLPDLPPFHGGIVGWLGYDIVREIERLPDVPALDPGLPDAVMSLTGHVAAFDHFRQRIYLIENVFLRADATKAEVAAAYEAAAVSLDALVDDLARPLPYQPVAPPTDIAGAGELPPFRSSMAGGAYGRAVEVAREHILAGDIFQVVLAQRFDFELGCDPFDVYRVLRQVNPSPYMYFLRGTDGPGGAGAPPGMMTVSGSSPEPMVQRLDGPVILRPI